MALREGAIKVTGLKQLSRSLRSLDKDAPKALRLAGNKAALIIVNEAKPKIPVGPAAGGHASTSIKAASTRTAARVSAGGKKFPYYAWLDFGGKVGRKKATIRKFHKSGRYIWKAYEDQRSHVAQTLSDELKKAAAPLNPKGG
ncbi:HK97 gp10 family phage protein [Saccharothrix sp. NRRL B-16348]|uniref:HK97 gp10 family phage protein n=1 Tax=Saccharothrix sp. NRRL B-16348 TaxID=1415542 RepID=UPI000B035059|nr:HK97 gp10 family phage protein [Saccharothrix sp. NRRL B-16348]